MNEGERETLEGPHGSATALADDGFELVDGQLVEKKMGGESSYVGGRLGYLLSSHLERHPLGWFLPSDAAYRCFPTRPRLVRKPDASFIRFGRLPDERMPAGDIPIPPDLAVEVVSPNDLYHEVDVKISEYLEVGVRLVWVVNPQTQTAHSYLPDGTARRLHGDQELDGGDVLPGFRCPVRELFRPPLAAGS